MINDLLIILTTLKLVKLKNWKTKKKKITKRQKEKV